MRHLFPAVLGRGGLLVMAAIAVTLVARLLLTAPLYEATPTADSATETPEPWLDPYAVPILTTEEAISRTLAALPPDTTVTEVAARLITSQTLETAWLESDSAAWMDDAPLWLVGVEAADLEIRDVIQVVPGESLVEDPSEISGAFMVWNATNGELVVSGALEPHRAFNGTATALGTATIEPGPGYNFTLERLLQIPSQSLPIARATVEL